MSETTPRWGFRFIVSGAEDQDIPHNEALAVLDAVVGGSAVDFGLNTPPAGVNGNLYVIGGVPEDDWADFEPWTLAYFIESSDTPGAGQWINILPPIGFSLWIADEQVNARYLGGTSWSRTLGESIFAAERITSGQAMGGSAVALQWNSQIRTCPLYTHSTSVNPDQITLTETGSYDVAADITVDLQSGTGWTVIHLEILQNGTPVASAYASVDQNMDRLTVPLRRILTGVTANTVLTVRGTRVSGTATVNVAQGGTRIVVRKV